MSRSATRVSRTAAALACLALSLAAAAADGRRAEEIRNPTGPAVGVDRAQAAQRAVDAARETLAAFLAEPQGRLRERLAEAHAVLIVPKLVRAAFGFVGGSGGRGLLLVRDAAGGWSMPAFYLLGAGSLGLELGLQRAEAMLLAATPFGAEALARGRLQLGVGASVAAGPVGGGTQAATADVLVYERAEGLYGGLALEGTVILFDAPRNRAYYGEAAARPDDVLRRPATRNAGAEALLADLSRATGG